MKRERKAKSSSKPILTAQQRLRSSARGIAAASDVVPLFEFSNVVNSSVDLRFILGTVLLTVMGKMLVSKGMVLLKREPGEFEVVNAKGVDDQTIGQKVQIDRPIRTVENADHGGRKQPWLNFFRERNQKLIIPILAQKRVIGLLSLGGRLGGKKYSTTDHQLINSLVNLSAAAIEKAVMIEQLRDVNRSLDRKYQELNTLFDLSKEFNVILDADKVIRILTFSLMGQIGVSRYAFCLDDGGKLRLAASKLDVEIHNTDVLRQLCALKGADLVVNLARQKKFNLVAEFLAQIGIVAVVPMQMQNQVKGAVLLGEKMRGAEYTKGDL